MKWRFKSFNELKINLFCDSKSKKKLPNDRKVFEYLGINTDWFDNSAIEYFKECYNIVFRIQDKLPNKLFKRMANSYEMNDYIVGLIESERIDLNWFAGLFLENSDVAIDGDDDIVELLNSESVCNFLYRNMRCARTSMPYEESRKIKKNFLITYKQIGKFFECNYRCGDWAITVDGGWLPINEHSLIIKKSDLTKNKQL